MITPHEKYEILTKELGLASTTPVYFKREDMHPLGSHKGRSIPRMIDEKIACGSTHFVISSSGNAALAAALYVKKLNSSGKDINLELLIGNNIAQNKLAKLEALKDSHILLSFHERPLQALFIKTQDPTIISLRQSTDPTALLGYTALAEEMLDINNLSDIFIGTSSGTTAEALGTYFKQNKKDIKIHIVQTSSCHPIADMYVENFSSNEKSIADAIVDQTAQRKSSVSTVVSHGWIAKNEDITVVQTIVKNYTGLSISTNSALSIAGLMQAIYTGIEFKGAIACMICGD